MNKVLRDTLIGGAVAGGLGMGALYAGLSLASESEVDQIEGIEACAMHLSETTQSLVGQQIQEACNSFDIGKYYLPPRQEFIETETANITTDQEQRDINLKISIGTGAVLASLGAYVGGVTRRRQEKFEMIFKTAPDRIV